MNRNLNQKVPHRALMSATLVCVLAGCSGGGGSGEPAPEAPAPTTEGMVAKGTWLHISAPRLYYGTREVGTQSSQEVLITNRGGDIYPLEQIALSGENVDEFDAPIYRDITLNPSEQLAVELNFAPISRGQKRAQLDIDFNIIKQASEEQNKHEQYYYQGEELEQQRRYSDALASYDHYADGQPATINKRRAAIKLPIIQESERHGQNGDFELYLEAVNARDKGDFDAALRHLESITMVAADSYLADDALYLRGYIELMDQQDSAAALKTMQAVRKLFPDSTYYDSALYSEALAYQDMGDIELAKRVFEDLKYRHTGGGFEAVGLAWPKDNLMSRLWFDRASQALDSMQGMEGTGSG